MYFGISTTMNEVKSQVMYEIIVEDKDGNIIKREKRKGHSVLGNWIKIFESIRSGTTFTPNDTSGSACTISQIVFSGCDMYAPAGDDSYGLVVGTGTTSVDINDHNLASKISHGTGSGQLSYGDSNPYTTGSGLTQSRGVERSFDNNSGGDITVNEIGLIMKVYDGSSYYNILILRDVISATTVPNGGRLTVKYWITWNP